MIDLFTWAFSLDLLGGTAAAARWRRSPSAISSMYENVIGEAWMVAAILVAGIWGIWKALVQRRYTETAGALARLGRVRAGRAVLRLPARAHDRRRRAGGPTRSRWRSSPARTAARSTTRSRPSARSPTSCSRRSSTSRGSCSSSAGCRHCVDTRPARRATASRRRSARTTRRATSAATTSRRARTGTAAMRRGSCASRPARMSATRSTTRCARASCRCCTDANQFAGYQVDKADAPAVDIQQAGGAFQRLTLAVVVFAGALGAVALLGFLSLAVILAQVVALVLLGFAPVALVVGIFPGAGHHFFRRGWPSSPRRCSSRRSTRW